MSQEQAIAKRNMAGAVSTFPRVPRASFDEDGVTYKLNDALT
jgi:hypothetical protein